MNWLQDAPIVQIEKVLMTLKELSDVREQHRLWLSEEGEISSFIEAFETLFDDSGLGLAIRRKQSGLSVECIKYLERLKQLLSKIQLRRAQIEIINDPAMSEIRDLAQLVAEIFGKEAADRPISNDNR